jgi:putative SOS response-associated peptidase YedK
MCGRYILAQQAKAGADFGVQRVHWLGTASYNIAAGRDVPVIRMAAGEAAAGEREGVTMRWGLIPPFLKGEAPKYSTINARIETMETSPAFRDPWKHGQRCLVPADGFYEWHQPVGRPKQPWFVGLANKEILPLAGLWDRSKRADGVVIESFAIVTVSANELMEKIDNEDKRMPAILRAEHVETWLTGSPDEARAVLLPYPGELLRAFKVSARVNSPRNDDAALLEEQSTSTG